MEMRKYLSNLMLFTSVIVYASFTSCGGDDSEEGDGEKEYQPITASEIKGTWEIKTISGNNTHSWLEIGNTITFNDDGSCISNFSMEDSYKIENGKICTYYKKSKEPIFIYSVKNKNGNVMTLLMSGTLDDKTSLTLTLQKNEDVNITGIWEGNDEENKLFSFSADGYMCGKISKKYMTLLSGDMVIKGKKITVKDEYTNSTIVFTVNSISTTNIKVDIEFVDYSGNKQNLKNKTLTKTAGNPTSGNHKLIGTTFFWDGYPSVYTKCTTRYSGQQSKSSLFAYSSNTVNIHYVYIGEDFIFQKYQLAGTGSTSWNITSSDIHGYTPI